MHWRRDWPGTGGDVDTEKYLAQCHVTHLLVDDDPHRTLFGMRTDEHNRPDKARIIHPRHRNQKLSCQIHNCLLPLWRVTHDHFDQRASPLQAPSAKHG
jgi:hypothetical protein